MTNEIKVGDKVRVREDAPRMYLRTMSTKFLGAECGVLEIIDGNAAIASGRDYIAIPLKYLIKVEDEAKERKFKRGDRVRVCSKDAEHYGRVGTVIETYPSGCVDVDFGDGRVGGHYYGACFLEPYTEPTENKIKVGDWVMISGVFNPQLNGMIGWVSRINEDGYKVSFQDGRFAIVEDKYLTLTVKPTEQTHQRATVISTGDIHSLDETRSRKFGSITIPVKVDLDETYWSAYAADLAKEVALKVANKFNAPEQAAEYAVSVAKAVVEGLKRK